MSIRQARFSYPILCLFGVSGATLAAFGCSGADQPEDVVSLSSPVEGDACKEHRDLVRNALARHAHLADDSDAIASDAVDRGRHAFDDRKLHGLDANGRACADCHMASENFQLTPAIVQRRWNALQACRAADATADDPLFRAIDADDFRTNGAAASDFATLRNHGLIRVTLPLPAKVRLVDPATGQVSAATVADVWRSVPSVKNVKLTGSDGMNPWFRDPNKTGGYQLDGRQPDLQSQARGAFLDHAQVQSEPSARMLDDLAAFQNTVFSSAAVQSFSSAIDQGVTPLPDPLGGPLTELEQAGQATFNRACAHCHGGNGTTTTSAPVSRMHNIWTQCPRPPRFNSAPCSALAHTIQTWEITLSAPLPPAQCPLPPNADGTNACVPGAKIRRKSSDPGRALLTGFVGGPPPTDDWEKFDVAPLRGIKDTAPYFINNSAKTLEEMLDHYDGFFAQVQANAPPGVCPPVASTPGNCFDRKPQPEEREGLLAFLRRL